MRPRVALSITRLMALSGLNRTVLSERASSVLSARSHPFGSAGTQIFASLALDGSLHQQILSTITDRARAVRSMRTSAEEKLSALIRFARLLLPISYGDAESLFNEAVEVAGEINTEAVHEIALFPPLAKRAVGSMGMDKRRAVARDLAIVIGDAGVRLAGYDHFPWTKAAHALTTLDVNFALAATARWEDSSVVDRDALLPSVLEAALSRQELSPVQVVAFSPLLDHFSVELIARVVKEASHQNGALDLKALSEELAREELLRFGHGRRPQVSERLSLLQTKDDPGFWLDQLMRATTFHQTVRPTQAEAVQDDEQVRNYSEREKERLDPLGSVAWTAHRFVSAEDIDEVIGLTRAAARAADTYLPVSTVLDRMRSIVRLGDRAAHLEALIHSESQEVPNYELAQAIAKGVNEWREAPSVRHWCQQGLTRAVVNLLPGFSRWLANGQSPLTALLEKSGVPDHQICAALLEGMERHVDALEAPTVYALVGLVGQYCAPDDAAKVTACYADRLVQRIPVAERDHWDLTHIPTEPAEGVARFLYAFMGDVDVRIRWQAGHALRRLARPGDVGILDKLVELYGRTAEPSFRRPDAPFYGLAACLWFVMALDRMAAEAPSAVGRHGHWLFEIATDNEFPHVLVRSFAKSAVCKLVESGALMLDPTQRAALNRANTSPVRRKKGRDPYSVRFDRYSYRGREDRRFHFDSMDTLPFWYTGALRTFVDVSREEFLDAAERWIVDRWGVQNNPWSWDDEPRQRRFSDRSLSSMDHDNGSRPRLERFHTYLEWHAMWCAAGDLMQTRSLARGGEDDSDTFERWVSGGGLTAPPFWLADLRGMKPLEDRLWFAPQASVDVWVEDANNDDFFAELGLISDDGTIVVSGYHDTRSRNFMVSARVVTALVSPDTAAALVRALQTVDNSWNYRIPPAGDELEINSPPYKLVGWLSDVKHEPGIDERDPLRHGVREIECRPSGKTVTALNLEFTYNDQARWIEANRRNTVFVYEAWGDNRGDERDDRPRSDEPVRSSGWRLRANKETLRTFLNEMGLDLIVEIEITRRNKGYDYWRYDEEKAKESRSDRVLLLRRDGTIEAVEGCLGAWTPPRA